jgi:DNA modification methylase
MTDEEFVVFLADFLCAAAHHVADGGVLFVCMDWRHAAHVFRAAGAASLDVLNIVVWSKGSGGLGGIYRSAHEFVFVLKKGNAPTINNVELGKHGRDRTNVWTYPGANRRGSSANAQAKNHPTPKPVELVADAVLDVTKRKDIILDAFLGSGTSIIAAEKTGRIAYGLELDPRYVDVIVRRYQDFTGIPAIQAETGKLFDEVAAERAAASTTAQPVWAVPEAMPPGNDADTVEKVA